MNWRLFILGVGLSSMLLMRLIETPNFLVLAQTIFQLSLTQKSSIPLSESNLCKLAKINTVRILDAEFWGSGILIQKRGTVYYILTNRHVLKGNKKSYPIQVFDGNNYQTYEANVSKIFSKNSSAENDLDLAILQFNSPSTSYQTAEIEQWRQGQKVLAAGFPMTPNPPHKRGNIFCTSLANVSLQLKAPMKQGYQLGYYLEVQNGMSGGPLFNEQGKVVGINGKGRPAIFVNRNLYLYRDGTQVPEPLEVLKSSSWAIPIQTIVNHRDLQFLSLKRDGNSVTSIPLPTTIKTPVVLGTQASNENIQKLAAQITVKIIRPSLSDSIKFSGTGVIIAKKHGGIYYVLTNSNVVFTQDYYEVGTYNQLDTKQYPAKIISNRPDLKLALLQFSSSINYQVPFIRYSYNPNTLTQESSIYIVGATILGKTIQLNITPSKLTKVVNSQNEAKLMYNNSINFSSGIILDESGNLIGIHSSTGDIITLNDFLKMVPPEVLMSN